MELIVMHPLTETVPTLTPVRLAFRAQLADDDALRLVTIRTASKELHDHGSDNIGERVRARLDTTRTRLSSIFPDDGALTHGAVLWVVSAHLRRQASLCQILAEGDLDRWSDGVVRPRRREDSPFGCEVARLCRDPGLPEATRRVVTDSFRTWEGEVGAALASLQATRSGAASINTDTASLASAVVAILQGGYHLACALNTTKPLQAATTAAAHLIAPA